ncbi:MAG: response regulator [Candidatus Hydrogenedentota bacterium]
MLITSMGGKELNFNPSGEVAHVNKPIRQINLLQAIVAVSGEEIDERIQAALQDQLRDDSEGAHQLNGVYVLLVEDNPMNQEVARKMLGDMGCHLTIVGNGQEAYDTYLERNFDVVLMDVQMPVMGGLEASKKIREQEVFLNKHTPIIAMTAHSMQGHKEMCLYAGMDDYISKPISPEPLYTVLIKWVSDSVVPEGEDSEFAQNGNADESEASVTEVMESLDSKADQDELPVDFTRLRDLTDGDEDLFVHLIQLFLTDSEEHNELLRDAVRARDADTISSEAHRLKGGAGQIGATRLHSMAATLENLGRENSMNDVDDTFSALETEYLKVCDFLQPEIRT